MNVQGGSNVEGSVRRGGKPAKIINFATRLWNVKYKKVF
jgi:hypothetical protein